MKTRIIQAEIRDSDFPVFESLFKKYKIKTIVVEEKRAPNKTTIEAMEDAEKLRGDKNRRRFSNVDELMGFLDT